MNSRKNQSLVRVNGDMPDTGATKADWTASITKGIVSAMPVAGGLVAEIVGNLIPNQRIDRIARFLELLDEKVAHLSHETLQAKMTAPQFVDLLEEGFFQAARAASDERKEQIASLVTSGLTCEQITLLETQKLLSLLGQLNDAEVILLRFKGLTTAPERQEFVERHKSLLWPSNTGTDRDIDRKALLNAYWHHLASLGLTGSSKSRLPQAQGYSPSDPDDTPENYRITSLGRLLLRHLDSQFTLT